MTTTLMTPVRTLGELVDPNPFRALVRQLMSDTGLPWRVLARASEVAPDVVRALLRADPASGAVQLRRQDARRLLTLTTAGLDDLRNQPAACETVRTLLWALGMRGCSAHDISAFVALDVHSVRQLMAGGTVWCSRLVQLRAEAACQAWGVDPDELLAGQLLPARSA